MRRLAIVLLALVLAFGAAARGGDEDIAGVGGTIIKFSEVRALYDEEPAVDDGFRDTLFAKIALEALTQALSTEFEPSRSTRRPWRSTSRSSRPA